MPGYRRHWLLILCLWTALGLATKKPKALAPPPDPPCLHLGSLSPETRAALRPEFLATHNTDYSLAIEMPEPRDQCQLGICWSFAMNGDFEREVFLATGK